MHATKMLEELTPWSPTTEVTNKVNIDDLEIRFKRTIRVPDNYETNELPPDRGSFPLYKVGDYAEKLPLSMAQKGGLFIPMHETEAMWIGFTSDHLYAIKVFVGGINAVSGEPSVADAATSLRRRNLIRQGKSVQDYVVVPHQRWLDGVLVEPGKVRQFVAMPGGTGYSIEAQTTGEEKTRGIQFEITRLCSKTPDGDIITVMVCSCSSRTYRVMTSRNETVHQFKRRVELEEGTPMIDMLVIYAGTLLKDGKNLGDYNIEDGSELYAISRLRGGGGPQPGQEMNIAAGGYISQSIVHIKQRDYQKTVPVTLNVQILNSASFEQVTGRKPPRSPVTAKSYADCVYPLFSIYNEPSIFPGAYQGSRSVAEMYRTPAADMPIVDVYPRRVHSRVLFNPQGSVQELEFEWEMEER